MEQNILNYLSGYVRIIISGRSTERFLNLCAFHDIRIWNLLFCDTFYEGNIGRKDFLRLKPVLRKCRTTVRIKKKYGFPFWMYRNRKRKLFLGGIMAAGVMLLILSSHIWKIQIEGNVSCSDEQILEYLYTADIHHGMKKSVLDCKNLAEMIRNQFSVFSWVSAELKGTVLNIQVKEHTKGIEEQADYKEDDENASSLYSLSDGVIRSLYVRNGISHVAQGEEVKAGTLLVSGVIPIVNDAGETASLQYVNADADIVIQKKIKYIDTVYFQNAGRWFNGNERNRYLIRIGKLVLGFPAGSCKLEEDYTIVRHISQLELLKDFYLPFYFEKLTVKEYEKVDIIYTKEKCEQLLFSDFDYFMKNLEEKGVQIFENDVKIEWNEKSAILSGYITVGETLLERRLVADIEEEIQKNEYG